MRSTWLDGRSPHEEEREVERLYNDRELIRDRQSLELMETDREAANEAEALAFLREYLPSEFPNLEPPDNALETSGSTFWMDDGIIFHYHHATICGFV